MMKLKFFFLIAGIFLRISAETTDQIPEATTYMTEVEIIDTVLSCWKFATTRNDEIMCKPGKNIVSNEIVQISSTRGLRMPSERVKEAKSVTISKDNIIMEKMPQKLGNYFLKLEKFNAMKVGLKSIQRTDFANLTELILLNLGVNSLTKIPYDVFDDLQDLEVLYLDNNKIRTLHAATFSKLTSLLIIFLNGNQLTRLEDVFLRNFYIEEIYLNNNFINSIDVDFSKLPMLQVVDLRRNSEICMKCETRKKVEDKTYNVCDYEKALKKKNYQECFQNCAITLIKSQNGSNSILDKCISDLEKAQNLNNELFQKNTKCEDKKMIPSLIKQFDTLIYIKLHNESVIRDNFDACVSDEISYNLEAEHLLKNCSNSKIIEMEKVEDFYTKCTFCRPSRIEKEMKKCNVRFDNSTAQSMDVFHLQVQELFRRD